MPATHILNIETATTVCSVSLAGNGQVLALRETNNGYTHAENLHLFIDAVMKEAGHSMGSLSAIAVSKGPGSYTGLRIGVSAAKGLAYALGVPLIAVETLQVLAAAAFEQSPLSTAYCPMLDARRMEVYTAAYNQSLEPILATHALIVDADSIGVYGDMRQPVFFGDGMPKCREILSLIPGATFVDAVVPSSKQLARLSYQRFLNKQFEDTAYFEPFYLKDFLIKKSTT